MLFIGLLFFIFLIIIRPQDFVAGLTGIPIVFATMAVLLTVWALFHRNKKIVKLPQDKFVLLFFFSIIISAISTNWISYIIDNFIETIKVFFIYCFIVTIIDSYRKFVVATWTLMLFLFVIGCIGILQYYGHDVTGVGMTFAADKGIYQIRYIGLFDNPNDLAYSVVIILPFSLGLILHKSKFLIKIIAIILFSVSIYCIILTGSRGGLLALVSCLSFWFLFWIKSAFLKKVSLILLAVIIFIAFLKMTTAYRDDESSMGRVEAWNAGMNMFLAHPLIGVGKGQFIEYHNKDSHNSYVRAGAELGFIGLYAFLGMLYYTIISILSIPVKDNPLASFRLYRSGYLGLIGAYLVASIFSTRTYDIVILVCIAMVSTYIKITYDALDDLGVVKIENENWHHERLLNYKIIFLTVITLLIWKLFLYQVW